MQTSIRTSSIVWGTVILYQENDTKPYEIVDGQQRILSFLLLKLCLNPDFTCSLLSATFSDKVTLGNLHSNSDRIREWCSSVDDGVKEAFDKALSEVLEVVVLTVNELSEAFQLFDSQNTRGRELYPHDLLKAYHLREIHDKYDMQRAVLKWESKDPKAIRELFDNYLFPLWNWSKRRKSSRFTAVEIDLYKGIEESSGYTYARRANKANALLPAFGATDLRRGFLRDGRPLPCKCFIASSMSLLTILILHASRICSLMISQRWGRSKLQQT